MIEISRVEARVLYWNCRKKIARHENPTPKVVFIGFILGLSDLSPS